MKSVAIAGSTGSIGTQTLDVIAADPDQYRVSVLTAGSSWERVAAQARAVGPDMVIMADERHLPELRDAVPSSIRVMAGESALRDAVAGADITINGIVGFAGLPATLSCLEAGRRLGLANKESLIAAGPVVQRARRTPGAELVPVDSEHAAVHQCLRANDVGDRVERLQITASGGPFRNKSPEELRNVTVTEALAHPTWAMGPKITVDSSTLMNKGLEVIEAVELFGHPAGEAGYGIGFDDVDVVIHPQSIVHSMTTFSDGSTIAQLSDPDMRGPIGYALAYPDRLRYPFGRLDWTKSLTLTFEPPDTGSFPCLELAFGAGRIGGTAPAWLSAANEVAVEAFLEGQIAWFEIPIIVEAVLTQHDGGTGETLDGVLDGDTNARQLARAALTARSGRTD